MQGLHLTKANDVLSVVVLYQQRPSNSATLLSLDESCNEIAARLHILLYDNSPTPAPRDELATRCSCLKLEYIHDPRNSGLARAYNVGLKKALDLGKKWLLIFDQDSLLDRDFVQKTLVSITQCPEVDLHLPLVFSNARIISPVKLCLGRSLGLANLRMGRNASMPFFAVNSGTLVSTDYLQSLGGYDERFSLYFTDNWFSRRFSKSGKPFAITGAKVSHNLAIDNCQDKTRVLWIYAQSIIGTRQLYVDDPVTLIVLFVFGFLGALKRAWIYRDLRFIQVFIRPVTGLP